MKISFDKSSIESDEHRGILYKFFIISKFSYQICKHILCQNICKICKKNYFVNSCNI